MRMEEPPEARHSNAGGGVVVSTCWDRGFPAGLCVSRRSDSAREVELAPGGIPIDAAGSLSGVIGSACGTALGAARGWSFRPPTGLTEVTSRW
jgi:hypothetical protein